eukprot:COSAG02_NODE_7696_length_2887_cov_17.426112_2_plen_313_part_00
MHNWQIAQAKFNNHGSHCNSGPNFQLDIEPNAERANFVQTGELSVTIPLPDDTTYYGVTFSDVRIFLVGLDVDRGNVVVTATKSGTSTFLDSTGQEWHFTHQETNPPFEFQYNAKTCHVLSSSDQRLAGDGMSDIYVHYSPYGAWNLQVDLDDGIDLSSVTAIRFEFEVSFSRGSFLGSSVLFSGFPNCIDVDAGVSPCGTDGTSIVPAPVRSNGKPQDHAHSDGNGYEDDVDCSTMDEFNAAFQPVNDECCDEAGEDCSSGFPTTCNAGCAAVLFPAQAACDDFLASNGLGMRATKELIDRVAATCPSNGH